MKTIDSFSGDYAFLSNFYKDPVGHLIVLEGDYFGIHDMPFLTVEHAYQAAKATNHDDFCRVANCETPGKAKKVGRNIQMNEYFESNKLDIMLNLIRWKFETNTLLRDALLNTGDAELIEGNTWGDTYWGVCGGKGMNHLGRILMLVRKELKELRDKWYESHSL